MRTWRRRRLATLRCSRGVDDAWVRARLAARHRVPAPSIRDIGAPGHRASLERPEDGRAGRPPRVALRIDEPGVACVYVQVTVSASRRHRLCGRGEPRLGAHGPHDDGDVAVERDAHAGRLRAERQRARPPRGDAAAQRPQLGRGEPDGQRAGPAAVRTPAPTAPAPAPPSEPGVPTVAQTVADGAVFPVAGPHNFGGPENVFGAPRDGYLHQGQDILTAEGTPVVAPLSGTILTTSYQEGGAGYYAVEQTTIGFDFMFAHCQESSLAVSHRPGGVGRAGAVQGRPDGRCDGAAPGLRDVGRGLAGRRRAPDQPAAVSGSLGR